MIIDLSTKKVFTILAACSGGDERLKKMIMDDLKATDYYICIIIKDDFIYISEKAKTLKKRLDEFEVKLNAASILLEGELILKELMMAFQALTHSSKDIFSNGEFILGINTFSVDIIHKDYIEDYTNKLKNSILEKLLSCAKSMNIGEFKRMYRPQWDSYEDMLNYYAYVSGISNGNEEKSITNLSSSDILEAFDKEVITTLEGPNKYKDIILTDNWENNICSMVGKNNFYCIKQDEYHEAVYNIKEARVLKGQCCYCGKSLGLVERCRYTTCSKHRQMEEYGERR